MREKAIQPPATAEGIEAYDGELKAKTLAEAVDRNSHIFETQTQTPEDELCLGIIRGNFMMGVGNNMNFEAAKLKAFFRIVKEGLTADGVSSAERLDEETIAGFALRKSIEINKEGDREKADFWRKIDGVASWMVEAADEDSAHL